MPCEKVTLTETPCPRGLEGCRKQKRGALSFLPTLECVTRKRQFKKIFYYWNSGKAPRGDGYAHIFFKGARGRRKIAFLTRMRRAKDETGERGAVRGTKGKQKSQSPLIVRSWGVGGASHRGRQDTYRPKGRLFEHNRVLEFLPARRSVYL